MSEKAGATRPSPAIPFGGSVSRRREHLKWRPEWSGPIEGWAKKFIYENGWRCDHLHEPDDLLQDAYLTFLRIEAKYPRVIEAPHFMALFKTAMQNEMWDRARYKMHKAALTTELDLDAAEYGAYRIGDLTNNGYLNALLAEAPEELKLALATFDDDELLEIMRSEPARSSKPKQRENLNMKLSRVIGFRRVRYDFVSAFKALLST